MAEVWIKKPPIWPYTAKKCGILSTPEDISDTISRASRLVPELYKVKNYLEYALYTSEHDRFRYNAAYVLSSHKVQTDVICGRITIPLAIDLGRYPIYIFNIFNPEEAKALVEDIMYLRYKDVQCRCVIFFYKNRDIFPLQWDHHYFLELLKSADKIFRIDSEEVDEEWDQDDVEEYGIAQYGDRAEIDEYIKREKIFAAPIDPSAFPASSPDTFS